MRAAWPVIVAIAACHPAFPRVVHLPDPAPVVEALAPPVHFGPVAHPATVYNEPTPPVASTPLLDDTFAALAVLVHGRGVVARDPRLDLAAGELADVARRGAAVTGGVMEQALNAHGVVESGATTVTLTGTSAPELAAELVKRLDTALEFGNVRIGIGGTAPIVAVVTYASPIWLLDVPRFVEADASVELGGTIEPEFHDPHVTITHDDGTIEHPAVGGEPDAFIARFDCRGHRGTQWVDVEVTGAHATPHVLVPIACGTPAPTTYATEPTANLVTNDPERRIVALINRERAAVGIPLLAIDPRARDAARAYAAVMAREHSIEHRLAHTTPASRLREAGLVPTHSAETTMHAESLGHAAELLLVDANYRANAISAVPTRVGVGLVPDGHGGMYVAIEYLRVEPAIDVVARAAEITAQLHAHTPRSAATLAMHQAAQWYADQLAIGWSDPTVRAVFWRNFSLQSLHVLDIGAAIVANDGVDAALARISRKAVLSIGVGVAQSARDGAFAGRVTIVIMTGDAPANGH